jgi:quinone-modifying oxidoreductase subunit QmoC
VAEALLVQPDTAFIRRVVAAGGGDLKKCMQCGTCSAVCELAPEDAPFPRKQMLEAQWGLKERVLADPALWLCHYCGDCTARCPRGARPGDVMGALRREAVRHFAAPRWMGAAVASPRAVVWLFLLPVLIFAAIAGWAPKGPATAEMEFANLFPIPLLEALFFGVSGLVLVLFGWSLSRYLRALRAAGYRAAVLPGLAPALREILAHTRFARCGQHRDQRLGHLLTLWGFLGLGVVGTAVGIGTMTGLMRTPLAMGSPFKMLANLAAAAILAGVLLLLAVRLRDPARRAAGTYFDWFFLLILAGVVATGIAAQILRLIQTPAMYAVYFVHLVLIFALFLYAPYSKFAHLVYRTVALAASGAGRGG